MLDSGQGFFKFFPGLFVSHRLQGALGGPGLEDSLDSQGLEGLVLQGMSECPVNILALILGFQGQNMPRLEAAVPGVFLHQALEKFVGGFAQGQEVFPDRFEAIPLSFHLMVRGIFHFSAQAGGLPLMSSQKFEFRAIEQDFPVHGLQAQNVGDIAGGHRVKVCLELYQPIGPTDHQRHFGRVIRESRQGLQGGLFRLEKKVEGGAFRGVMAMLVRLFLEPPSRHGLKVLQALEGSSIQEVPFDILEGRLHFSLGLGRPRTTGDRSATVMGDEGRESGIKYRSARLPAQDNCFFVIIQALSGHAAEIGEGVLVPADQGEKIPSPRELDKVPARVAQNIRETQDLDPALQGEGDFVRAPVHLALLAWFGLEPDDRFETRLFYPREILPQDGESAGVAFVPEGFQDTLTLDIGIGFRQFFYPLLEDIELAGACLFCSEGIMTLFSLRTMGPQNSPRGVTRNPAFPGDTSDRSPLFDTEDHLLFKLFLGTKNH